jgi:hypothetical protein
VSTPAKIIGLISIALDASGRFSTQSNHHRFFIRYSKLGGSDMRMPLIAIIAVANLMCISAESSAKQISVKLTAEQVKTVCGKRLQQSSGAMGCERDCGAKLCSYNCAKDKKGNGTKCSGMVVNRIAGGSGGQNPGSRGKPGIAVIPAVGGSILDSGPGFGAQGPAATGVPTSGGAAPPPRGGLIK